MGDLKSRAIWLNWQYLLLSIQLEKVQGWTFSTSCYWFQTGNGDCSNSRWEHLNVTEAGVTERPIIAAAGEMTFNPMPAVFDSGQRWVNRVNDGLAECLNNDQTYDSAQANEGLVTINIPLGRTSCPGFSSAEFVGLRTLRCRFTDEILKIRDEDNVKDPVAYYQNPDGEGYCLAYYRNKLLICNPGPNGGSIMGRLYGK